MCINVRIIEEYIHPEYEKQYIYYGRKWTYIAETHDGSYVDVDTTIYLSYVGSTAMQNEAFLAPNQVVILSGKKSVEFEIEVLEVDEAYGKFISTSGYSENADSCGPTTIQILSYNSTPIDDNPLTWSNECCEFYDKTYITWVEHFPTCMGNNEEPKFPGNMKKDGAISSYNWYPSHEDEE